MSLFFLMVWILVSGCQTTKNKVSGGCDGFCGDIKTYAARAGYKDLGPKLCSMARCETGNKCTSSIDSPNGLYHGPFQFSKSTWETRCIPLFEEKKVKECGKLHGAYDLSCSTICAATLVSQGGLSNWPVCGKQ